MTVVGLTMDVETACGTEPGRFLLRESYVEAVCAAGGIPLLLPHQSDACSVEAYLERIDALVVTGGAFDVPAELYGEQAGEGMGRLKPGRTRFELAIMIAAIDRDMPVLGVCGGMQLLNVAYGGSLHQDIGREVPNALRHEQEHDRHKPGHDVELEPGSLLAELGGGSSRMAVNSTHHQAVKKAGDGLRVCAVAPDGVIEAIEDPAAPFILGVQWHPELLTGRPEQQAIYDGLVRAARPPEV